MKWKESYDREIAKNFVKSKTRKEAFLKTAEYLGVTVKSVTSRYYRNKETIENMVFEIATKKPWYKRFFNWLFG